MAVGRRAADPPAGAGRDRLDEPDGTAGCAEHGQGRSRDLAGLEARQVADAIDGQPDRRGEARVDAEDPIGQDRRDVVG
jgi:hypothetical protein